MPRKPRIDLPGMPQHIIQRGNNREPCFYATSDYHYYLETLDEALQRYNCQLHSYVLMTNHVLCGAPHKMCNVKLTIM